MAQVAPSPIWHHAGIGVMFSESPGEGNGQAARQGRIRKAKPPLSEFEIGRKADLKAKKSGDNLKRLPRKVRLKS